MLLDSLAKEGSVSLFVVNSRALVPQQAEYLKGHSRGGLVVAVDLTHVRAPDVSWPQNSRQRAIHSCQHLGRLVVFFADSGLCCDGRSGAISAGVWTG